MADYPIGARNVNCEFDRSFHRYDFASRVLAAFIPLIAGTAGNSGTQALAVAVRGIATRDIEDESKVRLLMREAGTGLITGLRLFHLRRRPHFHLEAGVHYRIARRCGNSCLHLCRNHFWLVHSTLHAPDESRSGRGIRPVHHDTKRRN